METRVTRVLGLACSPRKRGNTDLMLDGALEGAVGAGAVIEKVHVPDLDINPCQACNACFKTGKCIQQDDMQKLYPKLLEWEGIILAAPIFSMSLAAQAKILIDRLQCCWAKKFVMHEHTVPDEVRGGRRGLWLSAAGMDREDIFEPASKTVKVFFGLLEIKGWDRVTCQNVDDMGDILEVEGALQRCREAGARLVSG